uniref:Synaptobrevin, longin-like domain protein n=1 Tax=Tanacetum cinerariifolium TaxID=118510 RepID=A0A699II17_TANCI|nr:hypothetical protein [Tanacetum cinerariifolium]
MLHVLRVEMVINSPWMLSKNWLVQKQTALHKDLSNPFMADNLPKIVWFSTHHITCMKSWLVQKQTALHKDLSNPFMADNLPKIVWFSTHHITCMKSWLVQKQTALGKDISNPLIVHSLLKTIWFSIHHHLTIEVLAIPGQTTTGVNTPRSDEDRLKHMELMGFLRKKGVCDEFGLNAARLSKFLLSGKCDVTRLQALVDKKRIVITKEVVREILQLNDAEGVVCLPNEEIFAGLERIGYEKPSTKLTFYNSAMASALIRLSSGQRFNFSKYIFECLVRNVDSSSKFYMYPRFIQLIIQTNIVDLSTHTTRYISPVLTQRVFANMRRVRKEEVAIDVVPPTPTSPSPSSPVIPSLPPHQSPCPPQPQDAEGSSHLFQQVHDTCSALAHRVEVLENDKVAQQLEIVKLKTRVKKLEKLNKVKSYKLRWLKKVGTSQCVESSDDVENVFNQGRISVDMDQDEGIELVVDHEKDVEVVAASIPIPAAKPKTLIITAAPAVSTRKRKVVVEMDAEYAKKLHEELDKEHEEAYKNIDWNAALDHVQFKEPQYIKRYHEIKKKSQSESEARKNMISYFKNTEGYKMEFFKGKIEEMEKEDEEIIKSINETPAQKAAKRRKLSEEAQEADDLKKRLEIVQDEDDDMFVEATPLAQKVPIVDYQIVVIDNKPKYKIDTHQFYISFTTLLKNFNREDLETLWRIVRDRFSTSKPTNFSDEYLLLTLKTMFRELDRQDAIWRNQKSVHGLALVKRWKLLTSCGVHVIILSTV